jgi:hypothetical protein
MRLLSSPRSGALGLLVAACLVAPACGDDNEDTGDTSASTAPTEAEVQDFVQAFFDNPDEACAKMTDNFLMENYGATGAEGQSKCQSEVAKAPPAALENMTISDVSEDGASVEVTDTRGEKATMILVADGSSLLLDEIRVESTSEE